MSPPPHNSFFSVLHPCNRNSKYTSNCTQTEMPADETSLRFSTFGERSAKAPAPRDKTRGTPAATAPRAQPAAAGAGLLRPGLELRAAWQLDCGGAEGEEEVKP